MGATFVILEGVCCAGKSTLSDKIASNYGYKKIIECTENQREWILPVTDSDARSNEKFYFDIEKQRMKQVRQCCLMNENVIVDRGPISIVSIAYSGEKQGKFNTFSDALAEYILNVKLNLFHKPSCYLYMDISYEEVLSRNELRYKQKGQYLDDFWTNREAILYQQEFYHIYGTLMDKIWHIIDSNAIGGESFTRIMPWIQSSAPADLAEQSAEYLHILETLKRKLTTFKSTSN